MKDVMLYTPLLVEMKLDEVDDIPAMLSLWKNDFLSGEMLEVWKKLERPEKPSGVDKVFGFLRTFLKWFWPSLALSIIAYWAIWSALFLSVILLPIQVALIVYMLLKLYSVLCIASAFNLENSFGKSSLP